MFVSLQLAAGCGDSGGPPRLPEVSDIGGPKMAHPQLVPIFFSDDPDVAALTSYSQWIVTSGWLHAVGAEYGVGAGTVLGVVHKAARAPDTISDTEIVTSLFQGLADGTLPQPAAGGLGEVIYVVNYPSHTVVTAGSATSCVDFGGYHASARRNGVELAYAVIATCPTFRNDLDVVQIREIVTSHEVIEAATDPFPSNHPGFQLRDPTGAWLALGGEVGDLCTRGDPTDVWHEASFVAQRSWSNTAAAAETDPCVPVPTTAPYFNVVTAETTLPRIPPGGHKVIELTGWATGATPDWQIFAQSGTPGDAVPTLGAKILNDGKQTTLDITVPMATATGTTLQLYVASGYSATMYQLLPMIAIAGDACSTFTGCEACAGHAGCGFCAKTGRCEAQGASGSAESNCPASSFATWPGSCSGFCAGHSGSCTDCASQPGCGWCGGPGGAGQCMEADRDYAHPAAGTCAYADWSFTPAYCPR
jgi:hypothetical protein